MMGLKKRNKDGEKNLEKFLNNSLEGMGGLSLKLCARCKSGVPDRLCILPGGKMFFIELKSTGEKLSALQMHYKKVIERIGFDFHVVDNKEDLVNVLLEYGIEERKSV